MTNLPVPPGPYLRSDRMGGNDVRRPWHRDSGRPPRPSTTPWDEAWTTCGIHFVRLRRRFFSRATQIAPTTDLCARCWPGAADVIRAAKEEKGTG